MGTGNTYSSEKVQFLLLCYTKSKNDSYSAKWHSKGFQNIKLVSHYSESESTENSECLDFVLLQVTPIVLKRHNFSCMLHDIQTSLPFHKMVFDGLPKYQIIFPLFKVSYCKIPNVLNFVLVQVTPKVQERCIFSFMLHKMKK